jgi:hypothetical protein
MDGCLLRLTTDNIQSKKHARHKVAIPPLHSLFLAQPSFYAKASTRFIIHVMAKTIVMNQGPKGVAAGALAEAAPGAPPPVVLGAVVGAASPSQHNRTTFSDECNPVRILVHASLVETKLKLDCKSPQVKPASSSGKKESGLRKVMPVGHTWQKLGGVASGHLQKAAASNPK